MPNIWLIFLTGLTTGGLSCLAVQGGLLANVIAKEATDSQQQDNFNKNNESIFAISLFLIAKIFVYTLLGLLLGWFGTMLQLGPIARAILLLVIAVFMIGTGLRMLNVHPIFNIFYLQPPKFIRKFIRQFSKNSKRDYITPVFLGGLTVLIPCGITQAMMLLAIGTANPLYGALIMFAFTLGASPVFFILAYFTTKLGENLHKQFVRIIALIILIFGLISLESSLNLMGSPVSFANAKQSYLNNKNKETPKITKTTPAQKGQIIEIDVLDYGYSPNNIEAKANTPTTIKLKSNNVYSCSRAFTIPELGIQLILPQDGTESIEIPAQTGTLRFSCSMGMYTGRIVFK
ncbi:sulfite exporter TauE/SafE family protein [Candidatus Berkelbacteria bacterium]|nr:sulfite exporter TauE/SafE family protein [Candidatus Berkelbacteria bacterium]